MDVTSITVEAGFTMNAGDYQSVKATIGMKAELGRGEDVDTATAELRAKVMNHLLGTAAQAHPDAARKLLGSVKPAAPALAAPKTEKPAEQPQEAAKRTRRTKEQIAADEAAAKAKTNGKLADSDPDNKLLTDEDEQLGGGEGTLGGGEDTLGDDDDDLLGGEEIVEVNRETLMAKLRELQKAKPAILPQLFKKIGVADFRSTPDGKYQELYSLAVKELAK